MDFFTKNEFDLLNKTKGNYCDRQIPAMDSAYKELSAAYKKAEFWVSEIQKKIFPAGEYSITKKPTNQANKFDGYLWTKLYPTKKDAEEKWLTITLALESDFCYHVKIDTVGLNKGIKYDYIKAKQDNNDSSIVKLANHDSEKIQDWQGLMDFTIEAINSFIKEYAPIKLHFSERNIADFKPVEIQSKHPLNQILYGPPGTGKTYYTKELAVKIADTTFNELEFNNDEAKRAEVLKRYDMLYKQGQIVFTTFHQSFAYEDFIEGIKPETIDDKITYDTIPGLFKELSEKAGIKSDSNFEEVLLRFKTYLIENEKVTLTTGKTDFDVYYRGGKTFKINPKDSKNVNPLYPASIENILKLYQNNAGEGMYNPSYVRGILNHLFTEYGLTKYDSIQSGIIKNHVLIIDEINRGNVSGIFGELITLLEEDKRLGNIEALEVMLPYSKEKFGIPPNLYIIGTMNTADRSVEALDTALRRRFSFTEIMPQPNLLGEIDFEDFTLEEVLTAINERIELLLDRDHTIGHSYFIKISSGDEVALKAAFKNCIIPLLQEYFYHDYEKIGLVLGKAFFEEPKQSSTIPFASFYSQNIPEIVSAFKLKTIDEGFDIVRAVKLLLNIKVIETSAE